MAHVIIVLDKTSVAGYELFGIRWTFLRKFLRKITRADQRSWRLLCTLVWVWSVRVYWKDKTGGKDRQKGKEREIDRKGKRERDREEERERGREKGKWVYGIQVLIVPYLSWNVWRWHDNKRSERAFKHCNAISIKKRNWFKTIVGVFVYDVVMKYRCITFHVPMRWNVARFWK